MTKQTNDWKRGLPPGKYYEGMVDDFEVTFTVGGPKWHRRRTAEEREHRIALRAKLQSLSDGEKPRSE